MNITVAVIKKNGRGWQVRHSINNGQRVFTDCEYFPTRPAAMAATSELTADLVNSIKSNYKNQFIDLQEATK